MEPLLLAPLSLLLASSLPYWGGLSVICAIIGYFTEYSGMRFGMFFLGEFIEVVFASAIVVTVFFGGWQLPFLHADGFHFGHTVVKIWHLWVVLMQLARQRYPTANPVPRSLRKQAIRNLRAAARGDYSAYLREIESRRASQDSTAKQA